MKRLLPFFSYYGSKHRIITRYPRPCTGSIIEVFCGSAPYATLWYTCDILLIDKNPKVIGVWDFLIKAPVREVLNLPLLDKDEDLDQLSGIPEEAKWLIGYWLSKGAAHPPRRFSAWGRNPEFADQFWGEAIRKRIARQVPFIRHWKTRCADYVDSPDAEADWFIDPPYRYRGGRHYQRFGSHHIDFDALAAWCKGRKGHVIVCEHEGADWLPFVPLVHAATTHGRNRSGISREVVWQQGGIDANAVSRTYTTRSVLDLLRRVSGE